MFLEYEEVLTRPEHLARSEITTEDVENALDVLAGVAEPVEPHFLWRPRARDADDDMVLEAAINGYSDAIVTFNTRDFIDVVGGVGIDLVTQVEILRRLSNESE